MAFCTKCGAKLEEFGKFCSRCGAAVPPPVVLDPPRDDDGTVLVRTMPQPVTPAEEPHIPQPRQNSLAQEPQQSSPVQEPVPQEPVEVPVAGEEPVYVPPIVPPDPVKKVKKAKTKKEHKPLPLFARRLLSALLCLLLLVSTLGATVIAIVRRGTSQEALTEMLVNIELSDIPADTLIGDADEDASLISWLRNQLAFQHMLYGFYAVSDSKMEKYLDSEIMPFVAEKLNEYVSSIYSGSYDASISEKELTKAVQNSRGYLSKKLGFSLSDEECSSIVDWLGDYGLEGEDLYETSDLSYLMEEGIGSLDVILPVVHTLTSYWMLALLCLVAVVCVVLLVLVNRKALPVLAWAGGTLTLAGLAIGFPVSIAAKLPRVWTALCNGSELVGVPSGVLLSKGQPITTAILGTGVVLVAISIVWKLIRKKRAVSAEKHG